jgi:hypothetical protein
VKVTPKTAKLLLHLFPQWKKFVTKDGSIFVRLKRALYGLGDSGCLWNKLVTEKLRELGFQQHPLEHTFFWKYEVEN